MLAQKIGGTQEYITKLKQFSTKTRGEAREGKKHTKHYKKLDTARQIHKVRGYN